MLHAWNTPIWWCISLVPATTITSTTVPNVGTRRRIAVVPVVEGRRMWRMTITHHTVAAAVAGLDICNCTRNSVFRCVEKTRSKQRLLEWCSAFTTTPHHLLKKILVVVSSIDSCFLVFKFQGYLLVPVCYERMAPQYLGPKDTFIFLTDCNKQRTGTGSTVLGVPVVLCV